jgi:hypothetical protein
MFFLKKKTATKQEGARSTGQQIGLIEYEKTSVLLNQQNNNS